MVPKRFSVLFVFEGVPLAPRCSLPNSIFVRGRGACIIFVKAKSWGGSTLTSPRPWRGHPPAFPAHGARERWHPQSRAPQSQSCRPPMGPSISVDPDTTHASEVTLYSAPPWAHEREQGFVPPHSLAKPGVVCTLVADHTKDTRLINLKHLSVPASGGRSGHARKFFLPPTHHRPPPRPKEPCGRQFEGKTCRMSSRDNVKSPIPCRDRSWPYKCFYAVTGGSWKRTWAFLRSLGRPSSG